ncbi:GGDEF domain-containing protein [Oceanospirillum sp.]|uniref:GGDEF domain-containing protein n=1 Tax=Oceanospirillum sp. TaxID=2021254 RepID=UPI003A8FDBB4
MPDSNRTHLIEKARRIAQYSLLGYLLRATLLPTLLSAVLCYGFYLLWAPGCFNIPVATVLPVLVPLLISVVISLPHYRLFKTLADEHATLEREVHRRRSLEHDLRLQANTDTLTGLSNRRAFFEEGVRRLRDESQTLVIIDLDFFKQVNDRFGHDIGDHVLVYIARMLSDHFEPEALLARMGGEEFALLSGLKEKELIEQIQFLNGMLTGEPLIVLGRKINTSLSAGIVSINQNGSLQEGIIAADTYLYKAKANGRCQVQSAI